MKKWLIGLTLGVALLGSMQVTDAASAYPSYWEMWLQKYQPKKSYIPRYRASRSTTTYRRGVSGANTTRTPQERTTTRVSVPTSTSQKVRLYAKRIPSNDPFRVIDTTPVQLFDLGFQNVSTARSTMLVEAAEIRTLSFEIVESHGIGNEWGQLELIVGDADEGTPVRFDENGKVTVSLQKLRVARGENPSIPVWLRVRDADLVPHIPGVIRVRMTGYTAVGEQSGKKIQVLRWGTSISSQVAFDPIPSQTGGSSSVSAISLARIDGKMLAAGAEEWALATSFEAHYDDLLVREIIVQNVLSGRDIDQLVDRIEAVDLGTGKVIGSTRFINGDAKFRFSPEISIARQDAVRIGFRTQIADQIRSSQIGTQFRLSIDPSDVEVRGLGSGQQIPNSNKNFSLDLATFTVASSVTGVSVEKMTAPLLAHGRPERVMTFSIQNPGQRYISVGRVSFLVTGSGVEFVGGGATPDDFSIKRISSSGSQSDVPGTMTVEGLGVVHFDFSRPFTLASGASQRFTLLAATENYGSQNNSDAVITEILSDSSLAVGTLSQLQAQGKNFIWSDAGATKPTASEWTSGYQIPGLPTGQHVLRRDGE